MKNDEVRYTAGVRMKECGDTDRLEEGLENGL
jgi:hypothetical protein